MAKDKDEIQINTFSHGFNSVWWVDITMWIDSPFCVEFKYHDIDLKKWKYNPAGQMGLIQPSK